MAWARIDDKFLDNPKVRKAGKEATYLYLSALVYSSSQLTEGFISDEALGLVAFKGFIRNELTHAKTLVDCGLWDRIRGGYTIHDYLEYNPTKAEIEQARAKKAAAGSKGGQATAQALAQARAQADAEARAQAESQQDGSINPSHPIPIPNPSKEDAAATIINGKYPELYAQYCGISEVTPQIQKAIDAAVNTYSIGWVRDAIQEGISHQAEKFAYVNKVLTTWKSSGRNGKSKPASGSYEAWGGAR